MICSEAAPLVKTGGLGDVTSALSKELTKQEQDVVMVLPYYKVIKENKSLKVKFVSEFHIQMSWRNQYVGIFTAKINGVKFYFIDNESYFKRDNIYGYDDDAERFAFFCLASLETLRNVKFKPDVIHVHDWHSAIIPCLIKERFNQDPFFKGTKSILTIHNPEFKGFLDKYFLKNYFDLSDYIYDIGNVRFEGMVSTLKAGIHYADIVTTVSPTHRDELFTYRLSQGLNYCLELRRDDFYGILNGIDVEEFNPRTDKKIAANYNESSFLKSKNICRKNLLETYKLPHTKGPIFAVVSRLTEQKGIDLILRNIDHIVGNGATLLILGSGERSFEQRFEQYRAKYPENVGIYIGYNNDLAHKIYAGSDFLLMPSAFEPCGISQMIAQAYGCLPIVRETGGLKDTVIHFDGKNTKKANGLVFKELVSERLGETINSALALYDNKEQMKKLIKNAMSLDLSWACSAKKYIELYEKVLKK